jgi:F like protein
VARAVMPKGAAFDRTARNTAQALAARRAELLDRLTRGSAATANDVLLDGLRRGVPPITIAERIRRTIGLTVPQARAVSNYRTALMAGQGHENRALRDRRFDASARRVADDAARVERMADRYTDRLRAYRAKTIARTETLRFANLGRRAAWSQAAERGLVSGNALRRFWMTAGGERTCPVCSAIPGMNPDGVAINGKYDAPDGQYDAPPDPHPGCRCTEQFSEVM